MENREVVLQKDRRMAMLISALIFLGVVAVCFFLTAFTIQDPPPGDQFVAVGMADFGDVLEAGGDNESEISSEEVQEVVDRDQSQANQTNNSATDIATQNSSDMSLPSSPKPNPKPNPKPDPKPSNALSDALGNMTSSNGGGGSDGNNSGVGNEGDQNGQIGGSGVVQGDLDSKGFSLGTRGQSAKPDINDSFDEEGTVMVDILVNQNGKVVSAKANPKHRLTSTPSSKLHRLAEKAALTAKFQSDFNAPPQQKGGIVIRFELN
jgi:outer membrane biosynthesis protein TonB